jgi:hypothetical protein
MRGASVVTLERIGHLEVLNAQERKQMRVVQLMSKVPPLIKGTTAK